jgi:hypothetical protein
MKESMKGAEKRSSLFLKTATASEMLKFNIRNAPDTVFARYIAGRISG